MMTPCVETVDVTKQYDGLCALDRVNIAAHTGQVTTIVGVNGSGKTTLLKILAGLDLPSTGRILIQGHESNKDELRAHCTMVFQKSVMFGTNVYSNVAYGLRIEGISSQEVSARVKSALAFVNLDGFEKRHARKLSSGEQQRVAMARALALGRDVLLIDEPTANLDPANAMIIERAIKDSARSRAVLLSTHNLAQARRLSQHVIHLYRGRVVEEGEPSRFFSNPSDERTKLFINGELQF
jgi:tungstate transport system ATP-binding protein